MGKRTVWWFVAAAGALVLVSVVLAQAGGQTPIYIDPKRPLEERVDDLLSRMTLKEKVGQLNLPCVYAKGLGKLKPLILLCCCGTTKVVPFSEPIGESSSRS